MCLRLANLLLKKPNAETRRCNCQQTGLEALPIVEALAEVADPISRDFAFHFDMASSLSMLGCLSIQAQAKTKHRRATASAVQRALDQSCAKSTLDP